MLPLEGVLVVTIEQAVAAPLCTARLREAGARVIKIERAGGDFARGYDDVAGGDSSYFLWLNAGKESLVLDFKDPGDAQLLHRILGETDVLVQNLAPGALQRSGFGSDDLRRKHPGLTTCDINGYGENGEVASMKAYDFLVQAESGLVSISGGKNELGRIGVSICDISAGMNAHAGILEALLLRQKTGEGSSVKVSLFGTAADWMTVPLLHQDYGSQAPGRAGLHHPSIAPYGGYTTSDQQVVIVAIQNEREWARFCEKVLLDAGLAYDPKYNNNNCRVKNREDLDKIISAAFNSGTRDQLIQKLQQADIAYGSVNSVADLSTHPALQRRVVSSTSGKSVELPVRPVSVVSGAPHGEAGIPSVPATGEHSRAIRQEFS